MNIIKDIVDRSGKNAREIAKEVGCSHMTIYNWMRKPKSMSVDQVEKLAEVLHRSPRNLFSLIIKKQCTTHKTYTR